MATGPGSHPWNVTTMSRLRRKSSASPLSSVAAEVLETRSLLSAGAASVHAAVNHASLTTAKAPAAPAPQIDNVPVLASIAVKGTGTASAVPGTISVSYTSLQVGGQMSGTFSLSQGPKSGGGDYVTAKGSFSGHIASIAQTSFTPPAYIVILEGGKVQETQRVSGHKAVVTGSHAPHNDSTFILTISDAGDFLWDDISYNITKPHVGGALRFEIQPAEPG
jgi:hypothetical protein